jgi:hypothetical protein
MKTLHATRAESPIPAWAALQRRLFHELHRAAQVYLHKYTRDDGTLIWGEAWTNGRDGVDDFYEAFVNWPLLYLLGGDDWFLEQAQREWDAITQQLTAMAVLHDEYEPGYDQFHQSEHYTYFYFLCLANPTNGINLERAKRFADLYLSPPNYDAIHKLIRAPHNGAAGPRWGFFDTDDPMQHAWGWAPWMVPYGLPFDDVPGVQTLDDLKQPELAQRVGTVLHQRYGKGDVAANLGVCPLIANAFVMTGDARYRDWLCDYVGVWCDRAAANGGLIPDNVGLSGRVGEYVDGRWFGGLYGWQWPHGYYNIGMATLVAATSAYLVTRDDRFLALPRAVMDHVFAQGTTRTAAQVKQSSLGHHWIAQLHQLNDDDIMFVVPYRHNSNGWFDYQPMSPIFPAALWALTLAGEDYARIERIRRAETYDWRSVKPFHTKEDSGHEQPWLRFLAGENPAYPEAALQAALTSVARRMTLIEQDKADLVQVNIHHWQQLNPVTTEALVQLTLGAPQPIYNGGLLIAPLRYFDGVCGRPGLPEDVAALVRRVSATHLTVHLVNISTTALREVVVQAGTFAQHHFDLVTYTVNVTEYPGAQSDYAAPLMQTEQREEYIADRWVRVVLPPHTQIELTFTMKRFAHVPSYVGPTVLP